MFGNHQRIQEVTEAGQEVSEMTTAQNTECHYLTVVCIQIQMHKI